VDLYPSTKQRAALRKLASALNSSSTALRIDECGDPRINGAHGHVYAVPGGYQIFVTTETPRQWSSAKKALGFAKVCNDGDTEGALILPRLPSPAEAALIRQYLGIRKRRIMTQEAKAAAFARLAPYNRGAQAQGSAKTRAEVLS
jgi:hypothetical protein